MSKESRRAARLARESRQAGSGSRQAGADSGTDDAPAVGSGATPTRRPVSGTVRAGRRERVRSGPPPTFFERYRNVIVGVAAVAIVAIVVGYVFVGSTAASYACGTQFAPSPTPPPAPGSSARLGFYEEDMGNSHQVVAGQKYLLCPPASGTHYNNAGVTGPIVPRPFKPDDKVGPGNWIHNLEHGGLVVLYRNDSAGASAAGQQAFRDYFDQFPDSPVCKVPKGILSPVIARFDDMPHPFAALVWDRVMYMDAWDPALANQFYLSEAERLDATGVLNRVNPPEPQCVGPSAIPGASAPAASGSVAPSSVPSVAPPVAPSAAPTASSQPSPSPAPS